MHLYNMVVHFEVVFNKKILQACWSLTLLFSSLTSLCFIIGSSKIRAEFWESRSPLFSELVAVFNSCCALFRGPGFSLPFSPYWLILFFEFSDVFPAFGSCEGVALVVSLALDFLGEVFQA